MRLVIVQTPFDPEIEKNVVYTRSCVMEALSRGEAAIAAHCLYGQAGVLREELDFERALAIGVGREWSKVADRQVYYTDLGWSILMRARLKHAIANNRLFVLRSIGGTIHEPTGLSAAEAIVVGNSRD